MWLLLLEPVFCKEGKILVHVPVSIWRLLGLLCLGALNSGTDVKIRSWYSVIIPIEIKRFFFFFLKYALKSAKPSHTWAVQGGQAQVPLLAHGLQEGQQEQGSKYHSRVCPCICDGFKLRVWGCGVIWGKCESWQQSLIENIWETLSREVENTSLGFLSPEGKTASNFHWGKCLKE